MGLMVASFGVVKYDQFHFRCLQVIGLVSAQTNSPVTEDQVVSHKCSSRAGKVLPFDVLTVSRAPLFWRRLSPHVVAGDTGGIHLIINTQELWAIWFSL